MSELIATGVGIDFGSGTCRVVAVEGTQHQVLCNDFEVRWQPMVTRAREREAAHYFQFESIKRHLGKDVVIKTQEGKRHVNDLATRILQQLKQQSEERLNATITGAAVAVPPSFADRQNAAMKSCAEAAGFRHVVLLDDARAAGLAYSNQSERRGKWLVYGLGRSIFFVTVLDTANGFKPLAHNGDVHLGGDDFDAFIVDELIKHRILTQLNASSSDLRIGGELLRHAENSKRLLSQQEQVPFDLPVTSGERVRVTLTRRVFEPLIADRIEETMKFTERTVQEAGLTPQDIDRVLLIGGSTHIPLVKDRLRQLIDKEMEHLPDDMIARGAAIYATHLEACFSREAKTIPTASQAPPAPEPSEPLTRQSEQTIQRTPVPTLSFNETDLEKWLRSILSPKLATLLSKMLRARRVGTLDDTIVASEEFLTEAKKEFSDLYFQRAVQLAAQGRQQEAVALLQRGYELFPGNTLITEKLGELWVQQAEELYKQGKQKEALKLLQQKQQMFPKSPTLIKGLATIWIYHANHHREQGKLTEALNLLKEGHRQFPENPFMKAELSDWYAQIAHEFYKGAVTVSGKSKRSQLLQKCREYVHKSLALNRNNQLAERILQEIGSKENH
jgi:TolA-binding protein/actin-like ATPase involved in cell morphogenesis